MAPLAWDTRQPLTQSLRLDYKVGVLPPHKYWFLYFDLCAAYAANLDTGDKFPLRGNLEW